MLESLELTPLSSSELQDIVLIAIDFEHITTIIKKPFEDRNSQVGIAILDTRDIDIWPPKIKTLNFAVGSKEHHTKVAKSFLFGKTANISRKVMIKAIESRMPRSRCIVLVGHSF